MMMRLPSCVLPLLTACLFLISCAQPSEKSLQTLRVATQHGPHSLDPRTARVLADSTVLNMLYEGLMRFTNTGELAPGVAESVEISTDLMTYTFHLRKSAWSNGDSLVAADFVDSWKKQLEPDFPAPNAFLLYVIKNARAAKAGSVPVTSVGIKAKDAQTIVVELEKPTPYFLQLTAFYALFPVHKSTHSDLATVFNGPFALDHYSTNSELVAKKNHKYWDVSAIKFDQIDLVVADDNTALGLFETGELDWIGSPLSTLPTEAMTSLNGSPLLKTVPSAAVAFLRFNVNKVPMNHVKIRQALALAMNRKDLVDYVILGNQVPATSFVPNSAQWIATSQFQDNDPGRARQLLQEAMQELHLDTLPPVILIYGNTPRNHKLAQALQQQWQRNLGIHVDLQQMEGNLFLETLKSGNYHIANGSWFADFDDPINFLDVFAAKNNGTNNTGWENSQFQALLRESMQQTHPAERLAILKQAEQLLISEMPIAPIFFYQLNYLKAPHVEDVGVTPLGIQIFRG